MTFQGEAAIPATGFDPTTRRLLRLDRRVHRVSSASCAWCLSAPIDQTEQFSPGSDTALFYHECGRRIKKKKKNRIERKGEE